MPKKTIRKRISFVRVKLVGLVKCVRITLVDGDEVSRGEGC